MDMDTFHAGAWQISLPADWVACVQPEGGEFAFESADGAKGLSIGTWQLEAGAGRTARAMAESFRTTNLASLGAMAGYDWEILVDDVVDLGPLSIALSDAWARAQSYRIIGVVLSRPPLAVRATFHDYDCQNIDASRAYFAAIVESLQLREPD